MGKTPVVSIPDNENSSFRETENITTHGIDRVVEYSNKNQYDFISELG
jgi:hypothetical protein